MEPAPSSAGESPVPRPWRRAAWGAALLFGGLYGALGLARFATFHSRSLDMAYYVRLVWGIGHGHFDNPVVEAPHLLGLHLEPILLPLALLGRLGAPIPELLLVVQAAATAAALWPLHRLARRHLAPRLGEGAALAAALSLYLAPSVSRCLDYDFHPSTMAIWPLLGWLEAVDRRAWGRSWGWLLLGLACREDVGLQLAAAGLTLVVAPLGDGAARRDSRRHGALVGLVGAAWFLIYVGLIQPRFLPAHGGGSMTAHFGRFAGGEGGALGVIAAAVARPGELLAYLLSGDRPTYGLLLLSTVALLPVLAPRWLAGALPVVGINLLSDFPNVRTAQSHYATALVPFLVAAAVLGGARLSARLERFAPRLRTLPVVALLVAGTGWFWWRGAAPGSPELRAAAYLADGDTARGRALVAASAGQRRVVAEARFLAHLAERPQPILHWPGHPVFDRGAAAKRPSNGGSAPSVCGGAAR